MHWLPYLSLADAGVRVRGDCLQVFVWRCDNRWLSHLQNRNGEYKQYCKEKLCSFRKAGCACEFHKVLALRAKELLAARHTCCA